MLPPLMTQTTCFPRELICSFTAAASDGSAGPFREIMGRSQREAHAVHQFIFRERDDVVEQFAQDREGEVEGNARGHALGERRDAVGDDALAGAPGACEGIGAGCLNADHLGLAAA